MTAVILIGLAAGVLAWECNTGRRNLSLLEALLFFGSLLIATAYALEGLR